MNSPVFLGNCYKVFINGRLAAIFPTIDSAEMYVSLMRAQFFSVQETRVELAFIEEAGF